MSTSSPYLAYTGIGARDTPIQILNTMRHLSTHLAQAGWTLRSGGAVGADAAFEVGSSAKEIYLPWLGYNNNQSTLHPGNIPFSQDEIDIAASHHPNWGKCSSGARKMHQRNLRQLVGHQSVCGEHVQLSKFVICWTERGNIEGGTGQTLRMAKALNIPIFNLGGPISPKGMETLILEIEVLQQKIVREAKQAA